MKILLARHADAKNQDGIFHGVTNVPLTEDGKDEAYDLAEKLREHKPTMIYSSPVRRSMDTAKILGGALEIPVKQADELSPLDLGEFVGKDTEDYADEVKHYLENPEEEIPNGESVKEWADKYLPFFDKLFKHKSNQSIIFLTHGRNIILTKSHVLNNIKDFKPTDLSENDTTTEHAGYALATPPNKFEIVDAKPVKSGLS